jgi:hypothetical protein
MTKIKGFEKVKFLGKKSEVQGHDIKWKVLPEGIQMCMKTFAPTNQKLWLRLSFGKGGQRSEGQGHNIKWKVLPEGIHMWNITALASTNNKL